MFHAAYAHGIRPSELSPSRNPCPSRGRCFPAVGHLTFAPAIIPRVPSRTVTYGRVGAGPPREGPLRLAFPRRRFPQAYPFASSAPHPRSASPPTRSPFRAHGWEPNGPQHGTGRLTRVSCWSVEHLRSEALLLLEVRSRRLQAALLDDGRCSPGLRPSRAFPQPALDLVFFASGCMRPGPTRAPFRRRTGPSSSRALLRPCGEPNER